MGHHFY